MTVRCIFIYMQQRIVVSNGKKYRVNCPSSEDVGPACSPGTLWMQSSDLLWYAINLTGTSASNNLSFSVNQTPLTWVSPGGQDFGYQILACVDNTASYQVYLSGSAGYVTCSISQTPWAYDQSNTKPYLFLQSITDGYFYRVYAKTGSIFLYPDPYSRIWMNNDSPPSTLPTSSTPPTSSGDDNMTLYGNGTPIGSTTPTSSNQLYIDQVGSNYWLSTGLTNTNWEQINVSGSYLVFGPATDTLGGMTFSDMTIDGDQTQISLPTIKYVAPHTINMSNCAIKTFSMPQLIYTAGFDMYSNGNLSIINIPNLISSSMNFDVRTTVGLSTLNIGSLQTIKGDFDISACVSLTNVATLNLTTIGGGCWWYNSTALQQINMPLLTSVNNEVCGYGCTLLNTVDLRSLVTTGIPNAQPSLDLHSNPALTNVNLESLTKIGGDFSFRTCGNLTTMSLNSLEEITGSLIANDCAKLVSFNVPALTSISGSVDFSQCYLMKSASFDSLTTIAGDVTFYRCFVLTDLKMPNVIFTNVGGPRSLNLGVCSLNQSSVDNILARCVASGLISASILLSGYNNAVPSAGGLADVTTLTNTFGCTVAHNS